MSAIVDIDFFSTGVLPTAFLCAPVLNLLCACHPVLSHDFQKGQIKPVLQPKRVATLRELLEKQLDCLILESGGPPTAELGFAHIQNPLPQLMCREDVGAGGSRC